MSDPQAAPSPGAAAPPVWLLDVDGVINAMKKPRWGGPPRQATAYADGQRWRIRWSPELLRRIRQLHLLGAVELRWCTTWCPQAQQLEKIFYLPVLSRALSDADCGGQGRLLTHLAKTQAALQVVGVEGRDLVWTDDDAIPDCGTDRDTLLAHGALLVAPDSRYGLQPADVDLITGWLAGRTGRMDLLDLE